MKDKDKKKAKVIMVQGTMSNAGKSLVVAGLCRVFKQDGYRVAPFKSQNMALNSFITGQGLEMGRAQVMQAEAAGIEPSVIMNPILLKPTDDVGSQVIVNGKVIGQMKAKDYFGYKTQLIPDIMSAYNQLADQVDIIVIEGAGSPAEINLKENDIVNMGMAKMADSPVILVGDIDRGGVFAQLLGTVMLLEEEEKKRLKGLVINKFRGDKTILDPGIDMLEERGNIPVVGVLPYMDIHLEDEDSLTDKFNRREKGLIDIAVIRTPRISNFTDFDTFDQVDKVSVRYVNSIYELGEPDMIIIPGSKSTISDMRWLRESGMEIRIKGAAKAGIPVMGICGGYQMLGEIIEDPYTVESGGSIRGLGLLPVRTVLEQEKHTTQYQGRLIPLGLEVRGYEIHMGATQPISQGQENGELFELTSQGTGYYRDNIYGTYIHGIFDNREVSQALLEKLSRAKQLNLDTASIMDYQAFKEKEYDKLADYIREYMDMDKIYQILNEE